MDFGGDSGDESGKVDEFEFVKEGYVDSEDELDPGVGRYADNSWCVCVCVCVVMNTSWCVC
jgi:hypothetical protein